MEDVGKGNDSATTDQVQDQGVSSSKINHQRTEDKSSNKPGPSSSIQSPKFSHGKDPIITKIVKGDNNKSRIRLAEAKKLQESVLKQHVHDMSSLVEKMDKLKNEEFDISNEKHRGILEALQNQFLEMSEQYKIFTQIKERDEKLLNGEDLERQIRRETYRLKNRLPSLAKRMEIEQHVNNGPRFLIIQGETGSGKSTQVSQYLADHPKFKLKGKRIVCTQPRKIAAMSLAQRVAEEYAGGYAQAKPGRDIGYQIGGKRIVGEKCRIEFITEGVMLDRIMSGKSKPFEDVGCIVIDEAHERSITCDILLGSFKKNDPRWEDILIVVTSATIDLQEFSDFYNNAPTIKIPGKLFPIDKFYYPIPDAATSDIKAIRKQVVQHALQIHIANGFDPGDILCFLPGQEDVLSAKDDMEEEIEKLKRNAKNRNLLDVKVFSLFGRQEPEQQQQVFEKLGQHDRKIIFATDVAETSITIDGVVYVVDSGVRKEMIFDPKKNMSTLRLNTISKSSATQRAGRSGRTQAGECHCLYSESDFQSMSPSSAPEVFRKPLSLAILSLMEMNIIPQEFEWINSPEKEAISAAEEELRYLGAVDLEGKTTELGKMISQCQQEPKLVRMIYRGCQDGFGDAALTIASIFTISNIFFYTGNDDKTRQESRKVRNTFANKDGDVVTMYRVFQKYLELRHAPKKGSEEAEVNDKDKEEKELVENWRDWCRKNFINGKAMGLIISTIGELKRVFRPSPIWKQQLVQSKEPTDTELRRLVFSGYFLHTARQVHSRNSRFSQYFAVHPCVLGCLEFKSALLNNKEKTETPKWIVYEKILRLRNTILPTATPIEDSWIMEESPQFFELCLNQQDTLPTEKLIFQTSQECLRSIMGRYCANLNSLEEELNCYLDVDIENGILAAYCNQLLKAKVQSNITKKIADIMDILAKEVIEEEYLGGTRVILGQGFQVKEVLFPQEYLTLLIRNLPLSISKQELNRTFKSLGLINAISNLEIRTYETNNIAVVKFNSKSEARAGFEILRAENIKYNGREVSVSPAGLGPKKGVTQQEICRLKLSWAAGFSEGKCNICFHSSIDANRCIQNVSTLFPGAKISMVHGDLSLTKPNRKKKFIPVKPIPPATTIEVGDNLEACRFRFVEVEYGFPGLDYKVTVVDLPRDIDEIEIFRRLKPTVPKWAKVDRKVQPGDSYQQGISQEEKQLKLSPLKKFMNDRVYSKFYFDRNLGRAQLFIHLDDTIAVQKAFHGADYLSLENAFGQLHKLQVEYTHTTSVHMDLYKFLEKDIKEIIEFSHKKGAIVNGVPKNDGNVPLKGKFIRLKFCSCNPFLIKELQAKLELISKSSKFNHEKIHLLFTKTGNMLLKQLSQTTFLHWNSRNYGLYIYGNPEVQQKAIERIRSILDFINSFQVFEEPLMLSKKKINLKSSSDTSKIKRLCASSKIEHYHVVGNRILVSGSKECVEALEKALDKEKYIFEKQPSHLSKSRGKPDCSICLMPSDNDFMKSSLCSHTFCLECIQPWFEIVPPMDFPVKCQGDGCQVLMGIGDIVKVAKKENLRKFMEVGVTKYQEKNPLEVFVCPKQECYQLLSATNKVTGKYGGEFYFCDECVTTYCIPCSTKANKAIKSHDYDSCEDALNSPSDEVKGHVHHIQESIFILSCPRCKAAFFDFNGCAAVTCESCKCGFCGLCLKDCGSDAHEHVRSCERNPQRNNYFVSDDVLNKVHKQMRIEKLKPYLSDITDQSVLQSVLRAIKKDLVDLHISESELGFNMLE